MPVDHHPSFELIEPNNLERFADILHDVVRRLESTIPDAAYNLLLRTAPWVVGNEDWSHWRIELLPRINSFAGLEVATGVHINPLPPERAAWRLQAI
jgi:UDPglucose--hexose-1-phosphate uridylyltransferase